MDEKKVSSLVREILLEIGEDPDREGLAKTPDRVARALALALTRSALVGWAFDILTYIVLVVMGFRILSRNLPKRQAENLRWLDWWGRTRRITDGAIKRHRDKEHKYYTCKQCGTVCRVPTGKGNIIITCPKCGAKIQAKT